MDAHYSIAYSSRDNNQISDDDPHIPIRVFLLSDHRLLRDALARSLGSQADISLVGAQESSLSITAEMIESTCDVLLVDPVNTTELDTCVLDRVQDAFSDLRVVMIDREAKIADVISAILPGLRPSKHLSRSQAPGRAGDDGKS
jgi:DNA-binding NarL/FixJ family response regulator